MQKIHAKCAHRHLVYYVCVGRRVFEAHGELPPAGLHSMEDMTIDVVLGSTLIRQLYNQAFSSGLR